MESRRRWPEWLAFGSVCAALVVAWIVLVLPHLEGRRTVLRIAAGESLAVVALAATTAALWSHKPWVFLLLVPLGMALGAAAHGIYFFGDGSPDQGVMIGFGLVSALFGGLPLGVGAAILAWAAWRFGGRLLEVLRGPSPPR